MSRIGNMPIELPSGVKVDINGSDVTVSGTKGKLVQRFHNDILVRKEDSTLYVERPSDSRQHRSLHGLTRALLNNMVIGVSDGYRRKLEIVGVGYRAELKGNLRYWY
jgi:large subunit ribosomal protein L6